MNNIIEKIQNLAGNKTRDLPVKQSKPEHVHNWEVVAKTYAPARIEHDGITTILWKCSCGEFKKEEMRGSDESTLEELVEKAEQYGPQYIQLNNNIYIISKYIAPGQQLENVPLR